VRALADALGCDYRLIQLRYRKWQFLPHVFGADSLSGLTAESAQQLQGPWPDLVISCGVRNEPVCRWIRAQSGGHTRYVHVGRPWASLDSFDLVITTPQYRIPSADNVVQNTGTLHSINPALLRQVNAQWRDRLAQYHKPCTAVIVGGDSGPFTLGPRAAARLGRQASQRARASGGSLLVTTSSRTRGTAIAALREAIDVPAYFYPWRAGDEDNPYLGILACADEGIGTEDRIAMLSEACATGKPVYMFDLGGMADGHAEAIDFRLGATLYRVLLRWFWQPLSRDITLFHDRLQELGMAAWLGQETDRNRTPAAGDDLQRAVARVHSLLAELGLGTAVEAPSLSVH